MCLKHRVKETIDIRTLEETVSHDGKYSDPGLTIKHAVSNGSTRGYWLFINAVRLTFFAWILK